MGDLKNLRVLDLYSNKINKIDGLDNLTNIIYLSLGSNEITEIKGLDSLQKLIQLKLGKNKISEVKNLHTLTELSELDLAYNSIKQIDNILDLPNIRRLYLNNNEIAHIANFSELKSLPNLEHISLENNPYFSVNSIVLEKDTNHKDVLLNELSKIRDSKQPIKFPVKICLLGNHRSGKTKFLNYFLTRRIVDRQSTKILNIQPFYTQKKGTGMPDAIFFDFGGQDYYHGIYKAFLTHASTNLLFGKKGTDANEKGKDFGEGGGETIHFNRQYWLAQLEYAEEFYHQTNEGSKSNIYQIQTHADNDNQCLHVHEQTYQYHYISMDNHSLKSSKYKYSLLSLKAEIVETIKNREEEQKTRSELKLYQYILDNQDTSNKIKISLLLKPYNKKQSEINLLKAELDQLSKKGIVLYYINSEQINNKVWINPTKTVQEIHEIFNIDILKKFKGKIPKEIFENKIIDNDLIELLKYNKVIFLDNTDKQNPIYIVPSYLDSVTDSNDEYFVFGGFNRFNFTLKFEHFIPFGFINQLICRYGGNPEAKSYRKDQLVFTTSNKQAKVLIRIDYQKLLIQVGVSTINEQLKTNEIEKGIFTDILETYWGLDYKISEKNDENIIQSHSIVTDKSSKVSDGLFGKKKLNTRTPFQSYRIIGGEVKETNTIMPSPPDLYLSVNGKDYIHYPTLENEEKTKSSILAYPISDNGTLDKSKAQSISTKSFSRFSNNKNIHKMKKIFISYSRRDVEYKNELREHLSSLRLFEIADNWSCEDIKTGRWNEQIQKELEESDMIVYMLSSNFFTSDYILYKEVVNGIKMEEQSMGKKHILCVIVGEFVGMDKFEINENSEKSELQEYLKKLSDYQYAPYEKIENSIANRKEEKIIPLNDYTAKTRLKIDSAYVQIVNRIKEVLQVKIS